MMTQTDVIAPDAISQYVVLCDVIFILHERMHSQRAIINDQLAVFYYYHSF